MALGSRLALVGLAYCDLPPSGMQGASTINPSLSTTLTLMINTLLPLEREISTQKRVVNLKNNINKMLT